MNYCIYLPTRDVTPLDMLTQKVVDTWCQTTGLSMNPGKTDVVIFNRRYKWSITRTLVLKWQRLEISKRAKYLGVILDNKLTWKELRK